MSIELRPRSSPASPASPSGRKNDSGYIRPKEAVRTREFWILWLTRFCIVLCTQVSCLDYVLQDDLLAYVFGFLKPPVGVCSSNRSGSLWAATVRSYQISRQIGGMSHVNDRF